MNVCGYTEGSSDLEMNPFCPSTREMWGGVREIVDQFDSYLKIAVVHVPRRIHMSGATDLQHWCDCTVISWCSYLYCAKKHPILTPGR